MVLQLSATMRWKALTEDAACRLLVFARHVQSIFPYLLAKTMPSEIFKEPYFSMACKPVSD